jgi:large subunit ribosomal protein L13
MGTFHAKSVEVERKWLLVDATNKTLGRMAVDIARVLMGKNKAIFTPGVDTGDYVVVVHAEKVRMTGRKAEQKVYRYHTEWVGGLKETSYKDMMEKHPERIIELAVRRMMPKTALGRSMMTKLKVFAGGEHTHGAQSPEPASF